MYIYMYSEDVSSTAHSHQERRRSLQCQAPRAPSMARISTAHTMLRTGSMAGPGNGWKMEQRKLASKRFKF